MKPRTANDSTVLTLSSIPTEDTDRAGCRGLGAT